MKIKNDSLDLSIIRKSIDIFSELENEAGLEIVYDKLVAFLTKNKNYEEAIIFNKLLIKCSLKFYLIIFESFFLVQEKYRENLQIDSIFNSDEANNLNMKIFYNLNRVLSLLIRNLNSKDRRTKTG